MSQEAAARTCTFGHMETQIWLCFLTGPGPLSHSLSHHNTVRLAPTLIVLCVGGIICELAVLARQENHLWWVGLSVCVCVRGDEEGNFSGLPAPDFTVKCDGLLAYQTVSYLIIRFITHTRTDAGIYLSIQTQIKFTWVISYFPNVDTKQHGTAHNAMIFIPDMLSWDEIIRHRHQ